MMIKEHRYRNILLCAAAAFLVSAAVSFLSASNNFGGGLSNEFCQYAEIARNIRQGKGMTTRMIYPGALALFDKHGIAFGEYNPVIDRFPLHAWTTAAAQSVFGESDSASLILSAIFLALLAAGTAIAAGLLMNAESALFAGLLIALSPSLQRGFLLWGLPDNGFAVLTLLSGGLVIYLRAKKSVPAHWAAAGAAAGLAWLYRSNFLLWLPVFSVAAILPLGTGEGRGAKRLLWWLGGFLAAASPGLAYNIHHYGAVNPPTVVWNLADHLLSPLRPWLEYRTYSVAEALARPAALGAKWLSLLWFHIKSWPGLWQFHLVWPAAAWGALQLWRGRKKERTFFEAAALYLALLILQVAAFSFLRFETLGELAAGRYYLWFIPAAALLAARAVRGLKAAPRRIYFAAALIFSVWWLASPQGPHAHPGGLYPGDWPELAAAAAAAGEGGLIATNLPGQIVWYSGRRALQLPAEPEDLEAIMRRHEVSAVLLTRLPLGEPGNLPGWKNIAEDPASLARFAGKNGFTRFKDLGTSLILAR